MSRRRPARRRWRGRRLGQARSPSDTARRQEARRTDRHPNSPSARLVITGPSECSMPMTRLGQTDVAPRHLTGLLVETDGVDPDNQPFVNPARRNPATIRARAHQTPEQIEAVAHAHHRHRAKVDAEVMGRCPTGVVVAFSRAREAQIEAAREAACAGDVRIHVLKMLQRSRHDFRRKRCKRRRRGLTFLSCQASSSQPCAIFALTRDRHPHHDHCPCSDTALDRVVVSH